MVSFSCCSYFVQTIDPVRSSNLFPNYIVLHIVITVHPGETSLWIVANTDGLVWKRLPLHVVCRHQPPTKVVETMVSAFPKSPAYRDNLKCLPIHYACKYGASINVIEVLINAAPNAIHARNRDNDKPLDLIMRDSSRDEREKHLIVQLLTLVTSSSDEEDENEE